MFSFFKKDPPKQQPPPPQQQQPPVAPQTARAQNNQQPPNQQNQQQRPQYHRDPLIADQTSTSVFAPSMTNFNRSFANNNNNHLLTGALANNNNNPNKTSGVGPTGNPKIDRLQAAFGDVYAGEVTFFTPSPTTTTTTSPQMMNNANTGTANNATSVATPPPPQQPRPIPNGFGELHSLGGGHTYTGYFKDGTRDGPGHLVTARFMIWGFWKENRIDINSSVRFDSLETLVKYRGFVKIVTDKNVKPDPLKMSTFSIYVAQSNFAREGWGEAVYPDGRHVFGRWENDELCGFGTQMTTDGERYIGMFHNSKFHGFGVLFLPNGSICEGEWASGVFKNTAGAITIPNRCVLSGQFNDRGTFTKVSLTLLDAANHSREDVETGLSFVTRAQYESLFFWATNPQILREEALQLAVPILAMIENLEDPMTAAATVEKEIRSRMSKTRRFDNALRVAQRVIFFQYGSCGAPSHARSGNGRATLGILTNHHLLNNNNSTTHNSATSTITSKKTSSQKGKSGSPMKGISSNDNNTNNSIKKPTPASEAVGWCETQKTGGCIHSGSGFAITAQTARQLFDDMLSFSASCRKYWHSLLQIGKQIRKANSAKHNKKNNNNNEDDDDEEEMVSETEVLNAVSRCAFDAIYGACRRLTMNVFNHAFYYEQTAAEAALERLRDVTLNDVGINFGRQSDDGLFNIYADATRALEEAFASPVPTEILHGLHRWSQSIDSATRESQNSIGGSADDLIPIHQFVLLRARIPHLVPMTKLVSWLGEQPCFVEPTSAESFCLTTLQACVATLHDLRANIRDADGVLQSPSALDAKVDDALSLLEDQGVPYHLVRRAADYVAGVLIQVLGRRQTLLTQMGKALEEYELEIERQQEEERQRQLVLRSAASNQKEQQEQQDGDDDDGDDDGVMRRARANTSLPNSTTTEQQQQQQENNKKHQEPIKNAAAAVPVATSSTTKKEVIYMLPSENLFLKTRKRGGASHLLMTATNSNNNNSTSSPTRRSGSIGPNNNNSASPSHGRPRGQSVSSAPVDRCLNEQMLHAISLIFESVGCTLVIAPTPLRATDSSTSSSLNNNNNVLHQHDEHLIIRDHEDDDEATTTTGAAEPNNMALVSNIVASNKKNNFGIKEAFSTKTVLIRDAVTQEQIPMKWRFGMKIPIGLLRSAPQLKIYATKLSV